MLSLAWHGTRAAGGSKCRLLERPLALSQVWWTDVPHETPLSNPNPSRLSACSVFLRLNAEQNSILNFLDPSSTILSCPSPFPAPSAVLYRTASATLHTAVPPIQFP